MSPGANDPDATAPLRDPDATQAPDATRPMHRPATPFVPGYEISRELGRGGMGVVYLARQIHADRQVAIKMILAGQATAAETARFRAEATAVACLQHPGIVSIFEVGEHAGQPFFSMEYCPNGSLAGRSSHGKLTAVAAAEMLLRIARGVAAAHAAGIVHRDLKPGNVLLGDQGEPKIADFGLAKRVARTADRPEDDLTATGAVLGTPTYMAPEQAGGARHVGPPADVYALGVMLYELLTGAPPFRGATPTDTLLLLLTEDPPPLRSQCSDLPTDLEAICLRCLDKDPARRYPTAQELADDLACFTAGEPVSAGRSGVVDRLLGAVTRVRLHQRFAEYGNLLLALAPVMLLPEVWITVVEYKDWPMQLLPVAQFGRVAAFLAVVGYFRKWRFAPHGPAERQLWTIWGGYVLCCLVSGLSRRLSLGGGTTRTEIELYQPLACLTALAFFALAPSFWGYCAAIGVGFVALSFVMAVDLRWAPLEFGLAWSAVLIVLGLRLRKLGATAETPPTASAS